MSNLSASLAIAELQRIAADPLKTHIWFQLLEALQRWQSRGAALVPLFDFVAAWVVDRFDAGELDYDAGDGFANDLYQAIQHGFYSTFVESSGRDDFWWRVYLAFDDGEFRRTPDENPVASYTEPQIRILVADIKALGGLSVMFESALR